MLHSACYSVSTPALQCGYCTPSEQGPPQLLPNLAFVRARVQIKQQSRMTEQGFCKRFEADLGCTLLPQPFGSLFDLFHCLREVQVPHQLQAMKQFRSAVTLNMQLGPSTIAVR